MRYPSQKRLAILLLLLGLAITPSLAQQSASFRLDESVFNGGGSPVAGSSPSSASYRLSQDALGEAVGGSALSSSSFQLDGGFVSAYAPVGEVLDLTFSGPTDLTWTPARSAVGYNAYRDSLAQLSGLLYGQCEAQGLPTNHWQDPDVPAVGAGYFYIITGLSRLDEEGTKGRSSDAGERYGNQCP